MARTAIATLQPVWDCRWSQPGHRLADVSDAVRRETLWVCTREGHRRNIDEHECATCAHWQREDATVTAAGAVAIPPAGTPAVDVTARALDFWSRVVTLLTGVLFAASGFLLLTGPLMIPIVVVLWLGAAAFGAFTFFGTFPAAEGTGAARNSKRT